MGKYPDYPRCIECNKKVIRTARTSSGCTNWGKTYVYASCCPDDAVITDSHSWIICWRCLLPHLLAHELAQDSVGTKGFFNDAMLSYIMSRSKAWMERKKRKQ